MAVYVLHIEPPYLHAKHYIGFTERTAEERLEDHLNGRGSPLITAALRAGSTVAIAHVWESGTRTFERTIKNRKDAPRWCPICAIGRCRIPAMREAAE